MEGTPTHGIALACKAKWAARLGGRESDDLLHKEAVAAYTVLEPLLRAEAGLLSAADSQGFCGDLIRCGRVLRKVPLTASVTIQTLPH